MRKIAAVKQEGNTITTYDENGCMIGAMTANGNGVLIGYTPDSFTVKTDDGVVSIYDALGIFKGTCS